VEVNKANVELDTAVSNEIDVCNSNNTRSYPNWFNNVIIKL